MKMPGMLSIRKKLTGAYSKNVRFAIIDGEEAELAVFDNLFDAGICLRFLAGKSMSRDECNFAESLLKDLKGEDE